MNRNLSNVKLETMAENNDQSATQDLKNVSSGPGNSSGGSFRQNRGGFVGHRGSSGRGGMGFRKEFRHDNRGQQKTEISSEVKEEGVEEGAEVNSKSGFEKPQERKFTGRCRLFVGNIPNDMTEEEFQKLFEPFGEHTEVFLNAGRGFGFVRMDTRHNAENARAALDGQVVRGGRNLRVRLAGHGAALRVKYLSQHVSNEILENTFSMFGEVERAIVVVDDKGRPTGEGIVEFARKPSALSACKRIQEGVFLISSQPRPIMVEQLEQNDETDGLPEIFFQKTSELLKDREQPPRFAQVGSFEYEFGQKWKKLYQMEREQQEMLKRNFEDEVSKLEMDQETAQLEQHTIMLRQDLQRRQEELRMIEEQTQIEIQRRMEMRRLDEERRRNQDGDLRRRQDEMIRRQMEASKGHQIHQNEHVFGMERAERPMIRGVEHGAPPMQPPPVPPGMERVRMRGPGLRFDHPTQAGGNVGAMGPAGNMGPGGNRDNGSMIREEHFESKRQRRF